MEESNPRVGLVLLRAVWNNCDEARDVVEEIEAASGGIVERLGSRFTVLGPWVVDGPESLEACRRSLAGVDLDMVLLVFQSWTDDTLLTSLLSAIGPLPLVLWCYIPWRRLPRQASFHQVVRASGTVAAISALGTLRNLNVPFLFTWGAPDDPRLLNDLQVAARAARVRQALREARFGVIPSRKMDAQSNLVDEDRLRADFGPEVVQIPVEGLRQAAEAVSEQAAAAYLQQAAELFESDALPEAALLGSARAALGLAALAESNRLDVLALNDASLELHRALRLRPALYPQLVDGPGPLYFPEADLSAATAGFVLRQLTGSPTMFLEFWYWDEAMNQVVAGHGGLQNPLVGMPGQVKICLDEKFCRNAEGQGARFHFIARPGRVTLFQLRSTPSGWQAIAATGVCLESLPVVEGFAHALLRLDTPIERMLNRLAEVGATQHWVMAYGSMMNELEALCQMEKIPLEVLRY